MPDRSEPPVARHVLIGAAAATARLTLAPLRPVARGVAPWLPLAAIARTGAEIERRLTDTGWRRIDELTAAIVDRALTSPATEELISRTLARPELERLVGLALDSELVDAATARFLESDEIERVIARIAEGPELRAAVAAQSAGLADMVAEEVRGRSVAADDTAERFARSLLPRRRRHGPPAGAAGT